SGTRKPHPRQSGYAVTSPTIIGVRRSRSAPLVWVDCAGWTVGMGDPVLVAASDGQFVAQAVLPATLFFAPVSTQPVGRVAAVGAASPMLASARQERDRLALQAARECAGADVVSAKWSLDLATLTLSVAESSLGEGRLRQKLGVQFRAVIRLERAVEAEESS